MWFTGNEPGQRRHASDERVVHLPRGRVDSTTRAADGALVLANEDYEGVNPDLPGSR